MVGHLTATKSERPSNKIDAKIKLVVAENIDIDLTFPRIAILLPATGKTKERLDPSYVLPKLIDPLNNPAIESIQALGGDVARLSAQGDANLTVNGNQKYWLVVISQGKNTGYSRQPNRQELAGLSQYFLPAEGLFRTGPSHLQLLDLKQDRIELPTIELE